jgi:hypothetical protein
MPAAGGTGRLTLTTARECAWTASAEAEWITITSGTGGQGDGAVDYRVSPNPDPVARRGGLRLNDQRAEIEQEAGACVLSLSGASASFPQAGGSGSIGVVASSQLCTWTAVSSADWVTIRSGSNGKGSASVAFDVAPTTGPPRTTTLTVAGQRFTVNQSQGCAYALAPSSQAFEAAGGSGSVQVSTASGCPWMAASNADWITLQQGESASGPGAVRYSVAATNGPARTGTVVIGGQVFTVTQAGGCALQVAPPSIAINAEGGNASLTVSGASGCAWTATTDVPWIAVTSGAAGSGAGTVGLAIGATTGPARTGTVTVAGQRITVTQSQGCAYAIDPTSQNIGAAGGEGTVSVTAGNGCSWTAAAGVDWIQIVQGTSGSGNGNVRFRVSPTSGPARAGTMTIAGRTFTVNQGQGCSFTLSPASVTVPASGGARNFDVQAAGGCGWTATSNTPWISIAGGASGSGNGTVRLTVESNAGPERSGTVTAGGRTFTVNQEGDCAFALGGSSQQMPAAGGSGSVTVTAAGGCAWTASSQASWLSITEGSSGTGSGVVRFAASENAGPPRSGTLLVGGRTFTVNQEGGCAYSIAPEQQSVDAGGGMATVIVTAAAECAWTAAANVPWITVESGSTGSGSGRVQLSVAANPEGQRTGTATIAGRTFTVTQTTGCLYGISPDPVAVNAAGGPVALQLTTAPTCAWSVAAAVPWITIAPPETGNGSGTIQIVVGSNTGPARSGSIAVASRTVAVSQEAGCTYSLSAPGQSMPAVGGPGTVTIQAGGGCPWVATSNAAWVVISSERSGSGTQALQFTVEPNGTGAPRVGTITFTAPGQTPLTFTINQEM